MGVLCYNAKRVEEHSLEVAAIGNLWMNSGRLSTLEPADVFEDLNSERLSRLLPRLRGRHLEEGVSQALSASAHVHPVDHIDRGEQLADQSLVFCELNRLDDLFEDLLFEPRVTLCAFITTYRSCNSRSLHETIMARVVSRRASSPVMPELRYLSHSTLPRKMPLSF